MKNIYFILIAVSICISSCKTQRLIAEGAALTLVADNFSFTEGPAADKNGNVYFTDQPNNRILKWNAATNVVADWLQPSGRSNGLYFDHDGNLLSCADQKNELWRIDMEKKVTVLINLAPRKIRGIESQGMILMAENNEGSLAFVSPEKVIDNGGVIS